MCVINTKEFSSIECSIHLVHLLLMTLTKGSYSPVIIPLTLAFNIFNYYHQPFKPYLRAARQSQTIRFRSLAQKLHRLNDSAGFTKNWLKNNITETPGQQLSAFRREVSLGTIKRESCKQALLTNIRKLRTKNKNKISFIEIWFNDEKDKTNRIIKSIDTILHKYTHTTRFPLLFSLPSSLSQTDKHCLHCQVMTWD